MRQVCSEFQALAMFRASDSAFVPRSSSLPRGSATTQTWSRFGVWFSTRLDRASLFVSRRSMRTLCSSFRLPIVRSSPASSSVSRFFYHVFTESNRAPNHALQRTAPRVTVAAISGSDPSRPSVALSYARCRFLRSTTQLPRRAPQSLSLGSLGALAHLLRERCVIESVPSSKR